MHRYLPAYNLYLLTQASVTAGDGITPLAELAGQFMPGAPPPHQSTGSFSADTDHEDAAPPPEHAPLAIALGVRDARREVIISLEAFSSAITEFLGSPAEGEQQ